MTVPILGPTSNIFHHLRDCFLCACARLHLRDGKGRRSRAREGLDGKNLEVEVLVGEAVLGPGVEVVGGGDSAGGTLALPDRPVLGEGGSASDRGLVGASVGALDIGRAVGGDAAELGHAGRAGIEPAVRFHDIVLGLGVVDPAVDGEVRAAAARVVASLVGDLPAENQPCFM